MAYANVDLRIPQILPQSLVLFPQILFPMQFENSKEKFWSFELLYKAPVFVPLAPRIDQPLL